MGTHINVIKSLERECCEVNRSVPEGIEGRYYQSFTLEWLDGLRKEIEELEYQLDRAKPVC